MNVYLLRCREAKRDVLGGGGTHFTVATNWVVVSDTVSDSNRSVTSWKQTKSDSSHGIFVLSATSVAAPSRMVVLSCAGLTDNRTVCMPLLHSQV